MKRMLLISFLIVLAACSPKHNKFLGGIEKLKWNSETSDIKNYMENEKHAEYVSYSFNRSDKALTLKFSGSDFSGAEVKTWELISNKGKFNGFKITFPPETNYEAIKKTLLAKLGEPKKSEDGKTVWVNKIEKEHLKEKVILRRFEDGVILSAETEEI